jgi:hypothetical protein
MVEPVPPKVRPRREWFSPNLSSEIMSRQAAKKIAFPAKEPTHHELRKVLELATRLMDRESRPADGRGARLPDNVIAFPGSR